MARGKHQKAKTNRDLKALQAQHRAALAQLERETGLLDRVQAEAAQVELLTQQLHKTVEERDSTTAAETARLYREGDVLAGLVGDFERLHAQARDAWSSVCGVMIGRLGGGVDGFEALAEIIGLHGIIADSPHADLDIVARQRIAKARGQRVVIKGISEKTEHAGRSIVGLLRAPWRQAYAAHGIFPDHDAAEAAAEHDEAGLAEADRHADAVADALVGDLWLDAVHAWHPLPWIDDGAPGRLSHGLFDQLGVAAGGVTDSQPAPAAPLSASHPTFDPAMSAAQRATAATRGPQAGEAAWGARLRISAAVTAATGRLARPWSDPVVHARPGDAVAVQHWYTLAALGVWSRDVDAADTDKTTPDSDDVHERLPAGSDPPPD